MMSCSLANPANSSKPATPVLSDADIVAVAATQFDRSALGFDPTPRPFDADAPVRLMTARGKLIDRPAPWGRFRGTLDSADPVVFRAWFAANVGPVVDRPRGRLPDARRVLGPAVRYELAVCPLADAGGCVGAAGGVAAFLTSNESGAPREVLFAEGYLGLAYLLRLLRPLIG